jgi:hypothetical protein
MPHNYMISQRRFLFDQIRFQGFRCMPSTDSKPRRPLIPVFPKNGRHATGTSGRHGPEQVVGIHRICWSAWPGLRKLSSVPA